MMTAKLGGGYEFEPKFRKTMEKIFEAVRASGADLLSAHLTDEWGETYQHGASAYARRDLAWVRQAPVYLAVLPRGANGALVRSEGTLIEMGAAIAFEREVLLVLEGADRPDISFFLGALSAEFPNVTKPDWSTFIAGPRVEIESALERAFSRGTPTGLLDPGREDITDIEDSLKRMAQQVSSEEIRVLGNPLTVLPGVFSPRFSRSPDFLVNYWQIPSGAKVLDLGCGTGVLSVLALLDGAGQVVAVDSNPQAIENARINLNRHGFTDRAELRLGSGYDTILPGERFDVVLLSPPFYDREARTPLEQSCFDLDHKFLRESLRGLRSRLAPKGVAFVVFSDLGDEGVLFKELASNNLALKDLKLVRPTIPGGHIRILATITHLNMDSQ
jgi:16S rRNA G1207 methylase RsmC